MNRQQAIVLWLAGANLALILAFPPYDYLSLAQGFIPTFGGFHFVGSPPANSVLNHNFLALEELVVLVNTGIAWLLLRDNKAAEGAGISRGQRMILWLVAINLVLILLFPPFEHYQAISKTALPSFDGFYFVFGDTAQKQIVSALLYIEVALVLINGGLLWLLFANGRDSGLTAEEKRALAKALRDQQQGGR